MGEKRLKYFANGEWKESKTKKYMDVIDPSSGNLLAQTPCCTKEEVEDAIVSAQKAFVGWSSTPILKRVQIMHNFKQLALQHMDELSEILCHENGKTLVEAHGDVQKMIECVDNACATPAHMMGDCLMDISKNYDIAMYREPIGVCAGIAPYNFPAMIPIGWMIPVCITTGNTVIIKAASMTPMTSMRCMDLLKEAGVPDGVVNLVTCSRIEAELFLTNPIIKGITFVGSTSVGRHIYETGTANGKRVQACCEAKNHALVLADAPVERVSTAIVNASFGCAGQRCMALPVIVVDNKIADELIAKVIEKAKKIKVGPAYDPGTALGPVINEKQRQYIENWIAKGVEEGAKLLLDGRGAAVEGYEGGNYVGPTIFDRVTEDMSVGKEEIFGPVVCFKRVDNFEEGIKVMNSNPFANGSAIYTQSGLCAQKFVHSTHSGNVGVNVGIPVPVFWFPFSGHKQSFFGDVHTTGKESVRFYTETKVVTSTWFEGEKDHAVNTWGL